MGRKKDGRRNVKKQFNSVLEYGGRIMDGLPNVANDLK
jgi:hypothetical protein